MKKVVFLVILVTLWVALLTAPVAAQDGIVTPDPASQGVEVGQVVDDQPELSDNQADYQPVVSEPGPQGPQGSQGQTGLSGKPGLRGHYGLHGLSGRNGQRGPAGKNANANGIYHETKSWNPASCSRVDAKVNQAFEKSKAYADGALSTAKKPVPVAPAFATTDKDKNWNWWWLLWPLLILTLLGLLLCLSRLGFWNWFTNPFRSKPAPARPIMTNTAGCKAFDVEQEEAIVEIIPTGESCIKVSKGYALSETDEEWDYAHPGEKVTIQLNQGAPVRFIISCLNTAGFPVSTDLVFPRDEFVSKLTHPYQVTKGSFFLGTEILGAMSPEDLTAVTSGKPISLKRYVDKLLPSVKFGFIYEVEITSKKNNDEPLPNGEAPQIISSRYSVEEIMAERKRKAADAAKKTADETKVASDVKAPDAVDKAAKKAKKADDVATPIITEQPPNFEEVATNAAAAAVK